MNKRQKKKLENRAGFFHYRDYKLRVQVLYDMFVPMINHEAPYTFKQMMFDYAKNMLFTKPPKKWLQSDPKRYDYKPFLTNCVGTPEARFVDIAKPEVIPSMSMRMVGDKIHSFSIDQPLDNGDVHEIRVGMPPLKKPLESKYGAVKVPLEMLNHETKDFLSELAVASRIPDEDSFKNGFKPDELAPSLPKGPLDGHKSMTSAKLSAIRENPEMVSAKLTIEHGDVDRIRRRIMADEHILGGSAIEYPSSATIDLRKAVGRYGNMSIKGTEENVSEPIHLGPIDLGPTDGERIEEHLDDLIDRRKRFAGNSCEASALD